MPRKYAMPKETPGSKLFAPLSRTEIEIVRAKLQAGRWMDEAVHGFDPDSYREAGEIITDLHVAWMHKD
jgi:hypothetical protein